MCPHQDLHYNKLTDDYSNTTPASNHPHNRHRSRLSDSRPPPRDELCAMEQARIMQSLTWPGRALLACRMAWQAAQQTQDHHPPPVAGRRGKSVGLQNITNASVWRNLTDRISYAVCPISRTYIAYPGNSYVAPILIHQILWKELKKQQQPGAELKM